MRSELISQEVVEWVALSELTSDEQELIHAARAATKLSYSPYSNFCVGCAIKLTHGGIAKGANFENASYGLGCCAERTTIFTVNNKGDRRHIRAIAVTTRPGDADASYVGTSPAAPCGACRQVIKESEDLAGAPITILMDCYNDQYIARVVGISALLPFAFGPSDLGIKVS